MAVEDYFYSSLSAEEIEEKLVHSVVGSRAMALSDREKAQFRANIGAGESNTGFVILGYYDTLEDLQESLMQLPQAGDAYGIGTAAPYDIYVYDGAHNEWKNNGPLNPGDSVIDDNDVVGDKTWSSEKINTELSGLRETITEDIGGDISALQAEVTTLKTYEALHISIASFSSFPRTVSNAAITANMRVIECVFGTPSAITSDVTWTTAAGKLTLSGSISGSTTAEITLIKTN